MANEKKSARLPGFYIALCCCVLVIGVAGYFTERQTTENNVKTEDVAKTEATQEPKVISVSEVTPMEDPEPTAIPTTEAPSETAAPEYMAGNPDVMETSVLAEAEEYFAFPAAGEILDPFSSALSFNTALGDYRTHNGIDIAADVGCSISAAADGTVENIFSNAFGDGISISHENGFVSKYMCLGSVEDIKIGDNVKAGDVIGTVGQSKGENVKEAHLHFEMYQNGTPVNPEDYLK